MPRRGGIRSYHHKSRNGCTNCKRRRVKCSMQAPVCANCHRRNEKCEYASFGDSSKNAWSSSSINHTDVNSLPVRTFENAYVPFNWFPPAASEYPFLESEKPALSSGSGVFLLRACLENMLCASWFTPGEISLWNAIISEQAEQFGYVQHCVFALSSLNLQIFRPSTSNQAAISAFRHRITASSLFRQSSPVVDERNWTAVLTFTISMIIFQFAAQLVCTDIELDYLETLRMLRSSLVIHEFIQPHLLKSKFLPFLLKRYQKTSPAVEEEVLMHLRHLGRIVWGSNTPSDTARLNQQAFSALEAWAVACNGSPQTWPHYLIWPATIPQEYMD
ncbi:uncharacterized protein BDR25DRAFT_343596 [Lindgomyces ingoldianus]|uniref:Uncharacterized protein n=1 Tax=Lindgomyces ingoldianus TaxID=673940 RepID=A0ACB6QRF6_9PLEO|nr:uncharacterized protein BDR25DRAFT_343596 [Lindgomyces ingoldianus]KAF2469584.1 hypothetical protein BDR25DRAFT_343596 [Lindgomyces ingoldianus]